MQDLMNAYVVDDTPVTEARFRALEEENLALQKELHASMHALEIRMFDLERLYGSFGASLDPEAQMVRADYEALKAQLVATINRYYDMTNQTAN